ncbi:enoyl-CoA hydratase/isomerase family protein [Maribacter sp. 2307ULW6-5]|uniref:enoyl-CoA hydratase/isomerase family protein n=1 Tax=Maribacter sp. 2307ULW6-5 TaxID=3386275 RepID=UPI0039BC7DA8
MTTDRPNGSLYTKVENGVATVLFGTPASNAFSLELLNRLAAALNALSNDDAVQVVLLKSEGQKAFCAGASFDELLQVDTQEQAETFFGGFAQVINAMRQCRKIIVGRVQGKAVGGGVGLIAACDHVYAVEAASIRLSELSIGIAPLVIAPALIRKMGTAAVAQLSFDPTQWKNAYWGQEHGLYARVFENSREMDKELEFYLEKLAGYHPAALLEWKKVLWENTDHWDTLLRERAKITGGLALSEFTKKALNKFKNS